MATARKKSTLCASVFLLSAALLQPAIAFDPTGNEIADAFLAGIEASGGQDVTVGSVDATGDTIVLNGLKARMEENGDSSMIAADALAFSNASIDSAGRIVADALALQGFSVVSDDGNVEAARMAITKFRLPSPAEMKDPVNVPNDAFAYESFELTEFSVQSEGEGRVPIARISSRINAYVDDIPSDVSFAIEGAEIDPAYIEDENTKKMLSDLGYDKLTLSMNGAGSWDPETARSVLKTFEISGERVGKLSMSAAFGGMTRQVLADMKKLDQQEGAMLELLQKITLESMSIRFYNETIVDRLLDHQAKTAGTDRAAFVQQISKSLPQILTLLNNPPFQEKVATALSAFLNAPKNLNIKAAPVQPVPLAAIVGSAMAAPAAVPVLLGVDVSANE